MPNERGLSTIPSQSKVNTKVRLPKKNNFGKKSSLNSNEKLRTYDVWNVWSISGDGRKHGVGHVSKRVRYILAKPATVRQRFHRRSHSLPVNVNNFV